MFRKALLGVIGFAGILLAGCATTEVALSKKVQPEIETGGSVLVIVQNNLDVTVPASNPGNTGILGALVVAGVDAARQASAEKEAKPIIDVLQDYDFRSVMKAALLAELHKVTTIKFGTELVAEKIDSDVQRKIDYDTAEGNVVLFVYVAYRLETGNLIVEASARMYPKAEHLKAYRVDPKATDPVGSNSIIYRRQFAMKAQGITAGTVVTRLNEAADSIAQQISADLNHPQ